MFIHLNNHSDYSLQQSISTIEAIVNRVVELKQPAVALTDYGNLFGVPEFAKLSKKSGIKAIYGCECTVVHNMHKKDKHEINSLVFLTMNTIGFKNLKILSSNGYLEGFYYQPRIDYDLIRTHNEGLICIAPQNNSIISKHLELGQIDDAFSETQKIQAIFGDRFYLEVQNHGLTLEYQLNQQLLQLSNKAHVSLVAGNNCHYIYQKDSEIHEIFLNTETRKKKREAFPNDQYYIKDIKDMQIYLKNFTGAIQNTLEIANRCQFSFEFIDPQLPSFPLPNNFSNENDFLKHISNEGIKKRYTHLSQEIIERINFELDTIISMKYSGYFLIVWDIIQFATRSQIPVGLGRGSVVGSIVAYALGITNIDPLKYGLLFERFLNPERISMPDIDTDFCVDKRQEVIDYIKNKYGIDRVGQIITFSQLKPRGAVRDVARALDIPLENSDEIAKLIPQFCNTLEEAEILVPKLKTMHENEYAHLLNTTSQLIGLHRHASLHAAGVVIGAKPLTDYLPLYRDPKSNAIATQYSMKYLEDCGLVKMDILGLRTLTIINKTEKLIQKDTPEFLVLHIPDNDSETFKMLCNGKSESVFQFESEGMQRVLIKTRPSKIEDLIALNALYRPGPMQFIDEYTEIKLGKKSPQYIHEILRPILEETYGIIIYQEQVMEIARKVAGYSLASADLLRRSMGKKDALEMEKQLPIFIQGAKENNFDAKTAKDIFDKMAPFAEYGFNKSHSAAYAKLAYQTAYLKCHYPVLFMISCINSHYNKPDELNKQLKVCRQLNIPILPPDVNFSNYEFSVEDEKIRYGFCAIKDMSDEIKHHIPNERKKNGKYTSILHCIERLDNNRNLLTFIKIGVSTGIFDSIDNRRFLLCSNIENIFDEGYKRQVAKKENQMLLFTEEQDYKNTFMEFHKISKEEERELNIQIINDERNFLGIHLTRHPIDPYKEFWDEVTNIDLDTIDNYTNTQEHTSNSFMIIAYIDEVRKIINAQKKRKTFLGTFEDYNGSISFMLSTNIANESIQIENRTVYGIEGNIIKYKNSQEKTFKITKLYSPKELAEKQREQKRIIAENAPHKELHITLDSTITTENLHKLKNTLTKYFGKTNVILHVTAKDNSITTVTLPLGFTIDSKNPKLLEYLKNNQYTHNIRGY